jgi:hypothetical protein
MSLHAAILEAQLSELRKAKRYIDAAIAQLRDEDLHHKLNPEQSSIAAYVQHLAGNMYSRFSDFLTSDGEKPARDREAEFADRNLSKAELLQLLDAGWATVFRAIESLQQGDLERTVMIRNEPHTVVLAITRQVAHYSYHAGQIVLLAKHIKCSRGEAWNYLTIPPGGSAEFNRARRIANS